ncbi:MAG: hypothetical protein II557_04290 [Clostridia bacterium]|nr:hypothetical protein [Clostridia bacterium]
MDARIIVCGLNGTGKSTFGAALAKSLGYPFLDIESYFFPKRHDYAHPRTHEEAYALLRRDMDSLPAFVLASVHGDPAWPLTHAILLEVPAEVRAARVRMRSLSKFGSRMLPGGDLCESEERFFSFCAARPESAATDWMRDSGIPVLALDGTKPPEENAARALAWLGCAQTA